MKDERRKQNATTFVASAYLAKLEDWYVDSGCSTHMCNDRSKFMNFKQCLNRSVAVANNQKLKCLGYGDIKLETNDNMADNKALKECVTCLEGKMSAQPYQASEACRASQPLELVHSDVCGPMQKCSFGGAKYFITFTDDHSRMTFGYMMRNKSEERQMRSSGIVLRTRPRRSQLLCQSATRTMSV
ncbi:hypothetical protein evm_014385 [Chilo suppressalis]|nr:hypothetical protein evm_014385 [Chilo suppressalis]